MKTIASTGREDIAVVYILDLGEERLVECVDALQPPLPIQDKWVLLVSTMFGCPVRCKMCDAGGFYTGKLTAEQIFGMREVLDQVYCDEKVGDYILNIVFATRKPKDYGLDIAHQIDLRPRRPELGHISNASGDELHVLRVVRAIGVADRRDEVRNVCRVT